MVVGLLTVERVHVSKLSVYNYLFSEYVLVSFSIAEFEIFTFKSELIEQDYDHITPKLHNPSLRPP